MPDQAGWITFLLAPCALAATLLLPGCGGGGGDTRSAAGSKPPFVLSISATPRLDPYPETDAALQTVYSDAYALAYSAGARGQTTTAPWSALEAVPNQYDSSRLGDLKNALTTVPTASLLHFVGIQVINGGNKELPSDLRTVAFDDARVSARFHALLDAIVGANPGKIRYLSIGNEVDLYFSGHPDEVAAYTAFVKDAAAYVHTLDSGVAVGVTGRADAVFGNGGPLLDGINAAGADVAILTYYPLQFNASGDTVVRPPSVVADDFSRMLAFAGNRPLVLQEVGYPASSANGSSEAAQADFFHEVFKAWQSAGSRLPFLDIFVLHDFTSDTCDILAGAYEQTSTSFHAYLCSLGLRQVDDTPRQAWQAVLDETQRLGLR